MTGSRITNAQLIAICRFVGVATILTGLALAVRSLDEPASRFNGGHFWGFVGIAHFYLLQGALVLATASLLTVRERPSWAFVTGAVGVAVSFALALKALNDPLIWSRGEDGVWGALNVLVFTTPLALLLLLPLKSRRRPLGGPSALGVAIALLFMTVATVVGLHHADRAFFSPFWTFVEVALSPLAFGALLLLTSLPLRVSRQALALSATGVACLILIMGLGHAIDFANRIPSDQVWFFIGNLAGRSSLALLVLAALGVIRPRPAFAGAVLTFTGTVVMAIWFSTRVSADFAVWGFLAITSAALATSVLVVMLATISNRERAQDEPQSWDEVPASVSP